MMEAALEEAIAVGGARGVTFPEGLIDGTMQMVRNFPPESKSSMLEDLERGRRLELPWLSGAIARMGEQSGVPTPTHAFINAILLPHQNGTSKPQTRSTRRTRRLSIGLQSKTLRAPSCPSCSSLPTPE